MIYPSHLSDIPASIREQIVLLAEARLQLTGLAVHRERYRPLEQEMLPAVVIYCGDNEPAPIGSNYDAPLTERVLDLHFEARQKASTNLPADQALDPILSWITYGVFHDAVTHKEDRKLGGLANDCFEKQTIVFTTEGDRAIASAVRTITIKYRTSRLDPTSKG